MPEREMTQPKTVIFTGPTGIEKKKVVAGIIRERLKKKNITLDESDDELLDHPLAKAYIRPFSLEKEIEHFTGKDLPIFLDERDRVSQKSGWDESFKQLCQKVDDARRDDVDIFIQLHFNYIRGLKRLNFFKYQDIEKLRPTLFITLLDDLYSIYHRITTREDETQLASYLTLGEINYWRAAEIKWSDFFARSFGISNYIMPVKHPILTFYKLIFERATNTIIYASYPITGPRVGTSEDNPFTDGQKEVNQNRLRLHQEPLIVFDPLTIDERSLMFPYLEDHSKDSIRRPYDLGNEEMELKSFHRWPLELESFPPAVPDSPNIFPLLLKSQEVHDILQEQHHPGIGGIMPSLIDSQISLRDLLYIRDAERMVAYRPLWKGIKSEGIKAELDHAMGKIPITVYSPTEEVQYLELESSPVPEGIRYSLFTDTNDFYMSLTKKERKIK